MQNKIFEKSKAYESLIDVYAQVARNLPRFERLSKAFRNQPEFQSVLVEVYIDILAIHLDVYKIARQPGWRRLFDSCWKDFGHRLKAILSRLATNRDLVDREAASFEIVEAMDERKRLMREAAKRENERLDEYARQVFEWLQLGVCDREQEDLLNDFQEARVPETCEWLMRHPEVMTWLDEEDKRQVLWLKGKPGSGEQNPACTILKVFCAQMLRLNRRLLPYIYEEHVRFNSTLPLTKVRQITKLLVDSLGHVFLVVDGIDEYLDHDQVRIFEELSRLLKPPSDTADGLGASDSADGTRMSSVKLFISSRETQPILREIKKRWKQPAVINLTKDKEHALVSEDISRFAKVKLRALHDEFDEDVLQSILESLMSKADDYESDLNKTICERILGLLTLSLRPMKGFEVCDAIVFHKDHGKLDSTTKLNQKILNLCKPLIEEKPSGQVSLVHFTARTYLLSKHSGPFVSPAKAQTEIALSCLRYLSTSMSFVSLACPPPVTEVIKGYHDLFPYAHEFWFDHLSSSVHIASERDLQRLRDKTMTVWASFKKVKSSNEVVETEALNFDEDADAHLAPLFNFLGPARKYHIFKNRKSESSRTQLVPLDAEQDPTRLSEAYLKYSSILESLLNNDQSLEAYKSLVSANDWKEFGKRHAYGAYRCRWAGCTQGWSGFQSERERDNHEKSHKPQYRCSDLDCLMAFDSKGALTSHRRDYHVQENGWTLQAGAKSENGAIPEQLMTDAYVSVPLGEPEFEQPWHISPNFEIIRQNACELADKTQKRELVGILERMPGSMKEDLRREKTEPLEYHFRKKAIGDFRQLQDEEMAKRKTASESTGARPAKVRKMMKNTARVELAEKKIDFSLSEVLENVKARAEVNPEAGGDWTDGVSHLWKD
ncbi:NACHT domain-containing protein [Colletotrichum melonis]|uniref:NACHT domain-containing protein n=1 Tax=Colletotrichum melonis TaxID=1209925 RepID=A0AAI9UI88_9PEZI|nr:NACHT domain-containing protein [Colletotrichum melonis]